MGARDMADGAHGLPPRGEGMLARLVRQPLVHFLLALQQRVCDRLQQSGNSGNRSSKPDLGLTRHSPTLSRNVARVGVGERIADQRAGIVDDAGRKTVLWGGGHRKVTEVGHETIGERAVDRTESVRILTQISATRMERPGHVKQLMRECSS